MEPLMTASVVVLGPVLVLVDSRLVDACARVRPVAVKSEILYEYDFERVVPFAAYWEGVTVEVTPIASVGFTNWVLVIVAAAAETNGLVPFCRTMLEPETLPELVSSAIVVLVAVTTTVTTCWDWVR